MKTFTYPKTFTDRFLYWLPRWLRPETTKERMIRRCKRALSKLTPEELERFKNPKPIAFICTRVK